MGSLKQSGNEKPQYVKVKAKARKGGGSSAKLILRAFTLLLLLLVLGGLFWGMYKGFRVINRSLYAENPTFEMQHLMVSSDGTLSEDRIREYLAISEGMNLFSFDFEALERRLLEVPAVESVYLERQLPHTLIVRVKERVPISRVTGAKEERYPNVMDRFGFVLPYRHQYAELPIIKGVEDRIIPGSTIQTLAVAVALEIIAESRAHPNYQKFLQIESLDVKYDDYIDMRLEGGTRVLMPLYSVKNKVSKLVATIQTGLSRGERYRKIDMTVDRPKVPVEPF
jgi:hypothetical protein